MLAKESPGFADMTVCAFCCELIFQSRKEDRPEPMSVSTASPKESVVPGGEVNFVKRLIADSLMLKDKVRCEITLFFSTDWSVVSTVEMPVTLALHCDRIYTTMLGKKASLAPLKAELRNQSVSEKESYFLSSRVALQFVLFSIQHGDKNTGSGRSRT